MHKTSWRLQDAKAQFSAVVEAAPGFIEHLLTMPRDPSASRRKVVEARRPDIKLRDVVFK